MRNDFVTKFWQDAYERLPAQTRAQYLAQMRAAEGWELAIGELVKLGSRAKSAFLRAIQAPRAKRA